MAQYVTVTYHSEYGVVPTETKIAANTVYTEADLPILTSEGREFVGWYTTSTFDEGTLLSVGDATVSNADYYAKWVVTVSSLLTNLADELRTLTNTTDKMGLSVMAGHVSDANTEVDEQSAVVDELMAALQGKSVPGGDAGGGIQYEVITIPAGATSATYTLPRVTHAYGSRKPEEILYKSENWNMSPIFSIHGTDVIYADNMWGLHYGNDCLVRLDIYCGYVRYESGTITLYDGYADVPLTLLLVNDPSAPAISM